LWQTPVFEKKKKGTMSDRKRKGNYNFKLVFTLKLHRMYPIVKRRNNLFQNGKKSRKKRGGGGGKQNNRVTAKKGRNAGPAENESPGLWKEKENQLNELSSQQRREDLINCSKMR